MNQYCVISATACGCRAFSSRLGYNSSSSEASLFCPTCVQCVSLISSIFRLYLFISAAIQMTLPVSHILRAFHAPNLMVALVFRRNISLVTSEGNRLSSWGVMTLAFNITFLYLGIQIPTLRLPTLPKHNIWTLQVTCWIQLYEISFLRNRTLWVRVDFWIAEIDLRKSSPITKCRTFLGKSLYPCQYTHYLLETKPRHRDIVSLNLGIMY